MTKVVKEGTKTMVMPLMIPGMLKGNHIRMKRWKLLAPRSMAAFMMLSSILDSTFSDQQDLASAQQIRDDEGSQGRYEYHGDSADNAGKA